jgi:SAM-dependent methyltransferase
VGVSPSLRQQFHDADQGIATTDEVRWYASRLPRDAGPVLEAMCGSGRLLVPLLREGFHVHGVDASAAMLAACEARVAAEGFATPLFRQDVTALNLPFRYGAAFVAAGSLQRLADDASMRRALERLRAHLVPPGRLLLDLVVPNVALHPPGAPLVEVRSVRLADGARIVLHSETTVDRDRRLLAMRNRYERRDGLAPAQREDETLSLTWLDAEAIAALLVAAGFVDVTVHPSPRPAAEGSFAVDARLARA